MNNQIKQLAEEAGFCFWSDESWKPAGAEIDWSSIYDEQFENFVALLKRELLDIVDESEKNDNPQNYLRYRISNLLGK